MTREEAIELCNRCHDEIKNRFPMNEHHYFTKIVSREGIEVLKCWSVCLQITMSMTEINILYLFSNRTRAIRSV